MEKHSAVVYGGSGMDGLFCCSVGDSNPFNGIDGAQGREPGKLIIMIGSAIDMMADLKKGVL